MTAPLRTVVEDGVATFTLDRPGKRNALNRPLVNALRDGLRQVTGEDGVRVVVIRGAGSDFCSGADLDELERVAELGAEASLDDAGRLGRLFVEMRRHPRPIIAAVHGRALAGGCGLATACDLVLARADAQLGYPEVHLGFVPAMVMSLLRRRVLEGRAFELVTSGRPVAAREAERIGLVNQVFEEDAFDGEVERYARALASRPPSAVRLSKRLLYGLEGVGLEEGIARGAEVNALARLTDACREGVREFLEGKR